MMSNSLTHYGVKGMEWGKRKKSYDDSSDTSPWSYSNRTRKRVYNQAYTNLNGEKKYAGRISSAGSRIKTDTTPLKAGKGLYKKGSGLGTGPVGTGGKKSVLKTASKRTSNLYVDDEYAKNLASNSKKNNYFGKSNKPKNSKDLGGKSYGYQEWGNQKSIGINVGDRRKSYSLPNGRIAVEGNRTTRKQKAKDAGYHLQNVANNLAGRYNAKRVEAKYNSKKLNTALKQTFNLKHRPIQAAITRGKSALKGTILKLKRGN